MITKLYNIVCKTHYCSPIYSVKLIMKHSIDYKVCYKLICFFCSFIHPNVRSTVYCYGVDELGVVAWDYVYQRFKTENVAGEAVKLLQSLGCTDETWLLQRCVYTHM